MLSKYYIGLSKRIIIFALSEQEKPKKSRFRRWFILSLWLGVLLAMLVAILVLSSVLRGDMPSFTELENPQYDLASVVFDSKDRPFGKYYIENREQIKFSELSPLVHDALIATEDERYYGHSGVDIKALFRVAFKTVLFQQESSGGGSTITQQLSKLLFKRESLRNKGSFAKIWALVKIKVKEWAVAARLEKQYTKEEIMMMYLNKFEFINGAHGLQSAAQTYFGIDQSDLTAEQAATLVGMLKNPSLYNPKRFPEKTKERRNVVLSQMRRKAIISEDALDSLSLLNVDMSNFKRAAHDIGPAPHFRSELTKWLQTLLREEKIKKPDGESYNIFTDGLKIYTTIDLDYQRLAEESVGEHMKWNQDKYDKVWRNLDPWTYEADSIQLIIRADRLKTKAKESDRYLALHNQYLGDLKAKAQAELGDIPLNENVIQALMGVKKNSKLSSLVSNKKIRKRHEKEYEKLLTLELWDDIQVAFEDLQNKFKEVFSTKIKMTVFDYSEGGEKEIEMSPMDSVRFHNKILQNGFLAVEPSTGYIKAWVGGVGFKYFKYDHVNSRRQVGSTIKPFVYATAISLQGISPCQEFEDIQYTIVPGDPNLQVDTVWSPSNANEKFTGNFYNLYQGLLYSKNSITVRLIKEMGSVEVIREVLNNVGIDKNLRYPDGRLVVPRVPSICLGSMDLTLKEMAGAYTSFANEGVYTEPIFVSRIEDKNGKVLYVGVPERKQAINPLYNSVMLDMLQNNVGGSYRMGVKVPIGGKTGTTNDYSDGWFMSVTPNLVAGTWVGGDDNWIRFLTLEDGQGFIMARPIVEKFFQKLEKDSLAEFDTKAKFPSAPAGFYNLIDCDKYKQVQPEDEQRNLLEEKEKFDEFEEEFDEEFDEEFEEEFDEEFNR